MYTDLHLLEGAPDHRRSLKPSNGHTPDVPIGRAWKPSSADVLCARSVRGGQAHIGRYVPGMQVSLPLYSDERRNSAIAFVTRSGASDVRR